MATLSPRSAAAIARLRAYVPPPTTWHHLPLSRRAAVLILLFADKKGELRVVLTMRSSMLKSYAGQAALPGGKADALTETPLQVCRREAAEEIGLPEPRYPGSTAAASPAPAANSRPRQHETEGESTAETDRPTATSPDEARTETERLLWDTKYSPETPSLPYPFEIEHLCQLPTNLAKTELGVRPCVALLKATAPTDRRGTPVDAEATLIPRLDAKEVAAVFSGPFHNFLCVEDEAPVPRTFDIDYKGRAKRRKREGTGGLAGGGDKWYVGAWVDWHETRFRMHNFYVPTAGQVVTRASESASSTPSSSGNASGSRPDDGSKSYPDSQASNSSSARLLPSSTAAPYPRSISATGSSPLPYREHPDRDAPDPLAELTRFRVFGMTARILVDCARVAYGEEPQFEHNTHFGDEGVIARLIAAGKLGVERRSGDEFVGGDLRRLLRLASVQERRGGAGRL